MSGRESVEVYAKGGHKPIRIYTGALCAFHVLAATDGTVYIADACGGPHTRGRVLVYPPGQNETVALVLPGRCSILPDSRREKQSLCGLQLGGELRGPGKALSAGREGWRQPASPQHRLL